jgi:hypothetical protein
MNQHERDYQERMGSPEMEYLQHLTDFPREDEAPVKLSVKHDLFPENEIIINGARCDIGGHKVHEDEMRFSEDAAVCQDCHDAFTE